MNKKRTTAYDEIKGMLNTMRTLSESKINNNKLITEAEETEQPDVDSYKEQFDNIEVINDVEVKLISTDKEDTQLKEDEKNSISQLVDSFRQQVSQLGNLNPGFSISETEVRLDGSIDELDINFVLIAGEGSGMYINSDMLEITNEVMEMLEKITKYQQTFVSTMEPILRDRKLS